MEIKATQKTGFADCHDPGDFYLTLPSDHEGGARRLSFLCPCGCGDLAGIKVRDDGEQKDGAWAWNRNEHVPTCTPSISINSGHWHGYLTDGTFRSC